MERIDFMVMVALIILFSTEMIQYYQKKCLTPIILDGGVFIMNTKAK